MMMRLQGELAGEPLDGGKNTNDSGCYDGGLSTGQVLLGKRQYVDKRAVLHV